MNNIILIRDQKIAHATFFGSFGGNGRDRWDPLDLVTKEGFLIPVQTFGARVIPYLNHSLDLIKLMTNEDVTAPQAMDCGVLIREDGYVCMVGLTDKSLLAITPVPRRGIHIFTTVDSMHDTMAACVDMTDTIEDAVEMYRKHFNFTKKSITIRPLSYYANYWQENRPTQEEKRRLR